MSEAELDALMARLAEGDRSAFDPLFRALHPRALRLAQGRVDAASASDVAQSALIKVFARASEFTPGRPVLPWFYAVLSNELRTHLRRQKRTVVTEPAALSQLRDARDLEAELLERELARALELAVTELDHDSAQAIHAMLGGERPQIDPVAFRKRVSRAYARLRLYLGGHHAD
ncbi:MAG TPA: RNA polymerase sigma factor [Polyangiales bacterium]|nr:RNA polymerase sigma factor [Polyangiales bacterium]